MNCFVEASVIVPEIMMGVAMLLFFVMIGLPLSLLTLVIALVGIVLLVLPRFAGHATNDAFLAVDLGPITFQPTELAKICIVVFLASYLSETRDVLDLLSLDHAPDHR